MYGNQKQVRKKQEMQDLFTYVWIIYRSNGTNVGCMPYAQSSSCIYEAMEGKALGQNWHKHKRMYITRYSSIDCIYCSLLCTFFGCKWMHSHWCGYISLGHAIGYVSNASQTRWERKTELKGKQCALKQNVNKDMKRKKRRSEIAW